MSARVGVLYPVCRKLIHVIPDILASAGGVIVSYFEMFQDQHSFFWNESDVHQRLDEKITKAYLGNKTKKEDGMAFVKEAVCPQCGKKFVWTIERPGDGYWDRWRSDDGNTAASWFLSNTRCWDHAYEKMPEGFRPVVRTLTYEEWEPAEKAG